MSWLDGAMVRLGLKEREGSAKREYTEADRRRLRRGSSLAMACAVMMILAGLYSALTSNNWFPQTLGWLVVACGGGAFLSALLLGTDGRHRP